MRYRRLPDVTRAESKTIPCDTRAVRRHCTPYYRETTPVTSSIDGPAVAYIVADFDDVSDAAPLAWRATQRLSTGRRGANGSRLAALVRQFWGGGSRELARNADLPSARLAEKRLEYRSATIALEGSAVPWGLIPLPFAVGGFGVLLLWMVRRSSRRVLPIASAVVLLSVSPMTVRAQWTDSVRTATRIRLDINSGERTLLRRGKPQSLAGTLVAVRGDTVLVAVAPGADPILVPRAAVRTVHVSRGVPNRFESAVRRAVVPTLAAAAFTAVSLNVRRRDGDPAPTRGALAAAASTAALTGALGFVNPTERWQKVWSR